MYPYLDNQLDRSDICQCNDCTEDRQCGSVLVIAGDRPVLRRRSNPQQTDRIQLELRHDDLKITRQPRCPQRQTLCTLALCAGAVYRTAAGWPAVHSILAACVMMRIGLPDHPAPPDDDWVRLRIKRRMA